MPYKNTKQITNKISQIVKALAMEGAGALDTDAQAYS